MDSSREDRLLHWLREQLRKDGSDRIGDDAGLLPKAETAVTVDHQIAGVHFPVGLDPRVVARRLLAVNLSDLAAMGARPRWATLALSLPTSDLAWVEEFAAGFTTQRGKSNLLPRETPRPARRGPALAPLPA